MQWLVPAMDRLWLEGAEGRRRGADEVPGEAGEEQGQDQKADGLVQAVEPEVGEAGFEIPSQSNPWIPPGWA